MLGESHVLFFGDSFVAGVGDPQARGWVGRVAQASAEAGLAFTPYVLGVRRETSVQVAARWRAEAGPRMSADAARGGVVFSFGANDAIVQDGSPRVRPDLTLRTLQRVLDEAAAIGTRAFVVGPGPVGQPAPDARIVRLTERMGSVCEARGVPFVAVAEALGASAAWVSEARAGDGTHPAAGGYEELARLVLQGGWLDWLGRG